MKKINKIKAWGMVDKYGDLLTSTVSYFRADTENRAEIYPYYKELRAVEITILPHPKQTKK